MTTFDDTTQNIISFDRLEPLPYHQSIVTIGNFDGVHMGHKAIIDWMIEKKQAQQQPVIVVTFFPNPTIYFKNTPSSYYLSTPQEKTMYLLQLGVDSVITFKFDQDFAELSALSFLTGLKQKLDMEHLVIGEGFALGKNREGTLPMIESIGRKLSFTVEKVPPVLSCGEGVSSTRIRSVLETGDVVSAAKLLGRPYQVSGEVIHGSDRGARMGLPTANIAPWQSKKLPAVGVYVTQVILNDVQYQGITNIGYRPTFEDENSLGVETHILDFDGNIYGELLTLVFIRKIRDEKKFGGVEEFLAQIDCDKATARRILSHDQE